MRRLLALAVLAFAIGPANASDLPNKPIRLIVGATPGGGGDTIARLVAGPLSDAVGQPVLVENHPGAAGNIGEDYVARAAPDGATLSVAFPGHVINPSLFKDMPFDPVRDFAPVAMLAVNTTLLTVRADSPFHSLADLIAAAKAHPGVLKSGTLRGSTQDMATALLNAMAGIQTLTIPYKGNGPAMVDLLGGRLDFMFNTYATVVPQLQGNRLRALANAEPERSRLLPDVPTMAEAGVPGFAAVGWYGILAPAATPKATVDALNHAFNQVITAPGMEAKMAALGDQPSPQTQAAFAAFIQAEIPRWAKVAREAHIEPE